VLKNVILSWLGGRPRLYDRNGTPVDAFNRFSTYIYRTGTTKLGKKAKKNYSRYTAKLFDYLAEYGLLDPDNPPTQQTLSEAVLMYPRFLIEGRYSDDPIISRIATSLQTEPVESESARTYSAGVNLFLKISHDLSRRTKSSEKMFTQLYVIDVDAEYIGNERHRSPQEINRITERGVIAANMPKGVKTKTPSAPLTIRKGSSAKTREPKDFPYIHLEQVIDACSPRNKCLLYMMAGGGLRFSEAIAAKKPLISTIMRKMRIEDPNNTRKSHEYSEENRYAWKGRETAIIYFFEPLKSLFFNAYAEYLAVRPTSDSDFLFLYEDNDCYGEPLIECSSLDNLNGTLNFQFKNAQQAYVRQTGIKPNEFSADYTFHSLRHFYGMWLRNRVRVPGRVSIGLELSEIQIMMGHKRLSSTEIYCRREAELIELDLELADYLIATRISNHNLALYAADQYERLARDIRKKVQMSIANQEHAE
jgi:integrase